MDESAPVAQITACGYTLMYTSKHKSNCVNSKQIQQLQRIEFTWHTRALFDVSIIKLHFLSAAVSYFKFTN